MNSHVNNFNVQSQRISSYLTNTNTSLNTNTNTNNNNNNNTSINSNIYNSTNFMNTPMISRVIPDYNNINNNKVE